MDPLMTFNADTYIHDLLRVCGGTNVFAECTHRCPATGDTDAPVRYPCVTLEDVTEAQPDVVLLPSEPYAFTDAHVATFAALDIPAARSGAIHLVDGTLLTWYGTRIAHALNTLPALLCPMDEP
jgi:ABC-type hemin transport system substrate-binding protein